MSVVNSYIDTIEFYELKVDTNSWKSEYMNTYEYQRSSHCLTFVQGHSDLYFQTYFQAVVQIKVKFHVEPLSWQIGGRKFVQMVEAT